MIKLSEKILRKLGFQVGNLIYKTCAGNNFPSETVIMQEKSPARATTSFEKNRIFFAIHIKNTI